MNHRTDATLRRRAAAVAGAVLLTVTLVGCGGHYYRATIQGFVLDDENGAGVNGAVVRFYTEEVDSPDAPGFVAQTSSATQGGNAGYYSTTVIWRSFFGAYGPEGDTTTVWIAVRDPDYADSVVAAPGILSEVANRVASVRLVRTSFRLEALRGRVVDSDGNGVNGVRVVLDLPVLSGADDRVDRVVQSGTIDGVSGTFEFGSVEWSDRNTADLNGEMTAIVRVDDPDWGDPDNVGDPYKDYIVERSVALVPGDLPRSLGTPITVYRLPRTEFTTTVVGRLYERITAGDGSVTDRPVAGVRVELVYTRDTDGAPETETWVTRPDLAGDSRFTVTWLDLAPGDYDDADERSGAVLRGSTAGIVQGEDGLLVDLGYEDVGVLPGQTLAFSSGNRTDWQIVSNPGAGGNRVPDLIRSAQ